MNDLSADGTIVYRKLRTSKKMVSGPALRVSSMSMRLFMSIRSVSPKSTGTAHAERSIVMIDVSREGRHRRRWLARPTSNAAPCAPTVMRVRIGDLVFFGQLS